MSGEDALRDEYHRLMRKVPDQARALGLSELPAPPWLHEEFAAARRGDPPSDDDLATVGAKVEDLRLCRAMLEPPRGSGEGRGDYDSSNSAALSGPKTS